MRLRKSSSGSASRKRKPRAGAAVTRGTRGAPGAQRIARPRAVRGAEGLTLGGSLTIGEVGACRPHLQRLLRTGGALRTATIDAQSLRIIDTAGLQLLLVAGHSAQQRGRRLAVFGASALLHAAAAALGLHAALAAALELHP